MAESRSHWSDPKVWIAIIAFTSALVGNAYVTHYRVGQNEESIDDNSTGIAIAKTFDARMAAMEKDVDAIKKLTVKIADANGIEVFIP